MADIFISYSRKDKDFVRRLNEALESRGREAWVDWEDIRPTEEFMQAIYGAIAAADTFLFVLTPDSVASVVCSREIAHAAANNKRMVPIVPRDVKVEAVPEALAKLNWIFFREGDDFEKATDTLISALDTDLSWVHSHTRLLTRAIEWNANGKNNSFVLRGDDLRSAEQWLADAGAGKDRQPTMLQTEYIIASRKAETRRQRLILGATIFALAVAIALAAAAWFQRNEARNQAQIALARQLAAQSELLRNQDLQRSVLLAAESMRRFPSIEADLALRASVSLLPRRVAQMQHDGNVRSVGITFDGKYAVSGGEDRTARIWEVPSGKQVARLEHKGPVRAVLLSPDGKCLATRTETTQSARLWTVPTGKLIAEIPTGQWGNAIAFSPDSKSFSIATSAGLLICDTTTGKKTSQFPGRATWALAFSPDCKHVTNGESVWETGSGKEVSRFSKGEKGIRAVAFSPDGKYIATGTSDQLALLWDPATGQLVKTLRQRRQRSYAALDYLFHNDYRMTVSLNEDGKYLATAGGDIQARVWEIDDQQEIATLPHQSMVVGAVFTRDGQRVLTIGPDVRLWEAFTNHELTRIAEGGAYAEEQATSDSGKYVVVARGKSVSVWESTTGMVSRRLLHKTAATDVTFTPDGKLLATCDTTTAQVWNAASGQVLVPPMVQTEPNARVFGGSVLQKLKSVGFSADGNLLATANGDQTARIWDVSTGSEIARIPPRGQVNNVLLMRSAFLSPDSKFLATASDGIGEPEEHVDLWEAPDWHLTFHQEGGSILFSQDGHFLGIANKNNLRILGVAHRNQVGSINAQGLIAAFVFSQDSKYVATADDKGGVEISELPSGRRVATLKHEAAVGSVIFSPDGKYVASISGHTARIWDWIKGTEVSRFQHEADVAFAAFSPDGTSLATAAGNDAHVWDTVSGRELARISHDQFVTRVVFRPPDGKTLATASDDGVVQLSLWHPQDLLDEACARLTRNLTSDEWHQYLGNEPYRKTCPGLP